MGKLTKAEVARRQLGAALSLYLEDRDPVSVHSLACAGCEVAETLAKKAGSPPMRTFTLASNPSMTDAKFVTIRNMYGNAFKHSEARNGAERDDEHLFLSFTERENEERLFVGWSDYSFAGLPMPAEAQVFVTWFLALDFNKFAADIDPSFLRGLDLTFPGLADLQPDRRKQRLRRTIEKWKKDRKGKGDLQTDTGR